MSKVYTLDGVIINLGDWDFQESFELRYGNPYLGEGPEPEDWKSYPYEEVVINNPLPEGAIEEDLEVSFDSRGILRRSEDLQRVETSYLVEAYRKELVDLTLDIQLGLATDEDLERAKTIRTFIRENP